MFNDTDFCSMKITEDVRKYAAEQGIAEEEALKKGMESSHAPLVAKLLWLVFDPAALPAIHSFSRFANTRSAVSASSGSNPSHASSS